VAIIVVRAIYFELDLPVTQKLNTITNVIVSSEKAGKNIQD
jgi:hypothetical protein